MSLDELVELPDAEAITFKKISSSFTQDDLIHLMNTVSKGIELIIRSTQPGIALEIILIKAASLKPLLPIDQILSDLKKFKNTIDESGGLSTNVKTTESSIFKKDARDTGIYAGRQGSKIDNMVNAGERTLKGFIDYVYQKNGPIAVELGESNVSIEKNNEVNIFISGNNKNRFTDLEKNIELIRQLVKEYFGINYNVAIHKDAAVENNNEIIKDDQKLNKLLDVFGAKIIKKM